MSAFGGKADVEGGPAERLLLTQFPIVHRAAVARVSKSGPRAGDQHDQPEQPYHNEAAAVGAGQILAGIPNVLSLPTRPGMLRPLEFFKLLWLVGASEMELYGTHDLAPPPGGGFTAQVSVYASDDVERL